MVASLSSPADVVNVSLIRIGWKQSIANLYDGSVAARLALDIYGQTRDEFLRELNPDFSMRNAAMTLLKSSSSDGGYIAGVQPWNPAVNPPVGWLFEYLYPEDCLKVRGIKPLPPLWPSVDPSDTPFSIDNDTQVPDGVGGFTTQRVILCNVRNALIVYTGRVTDPTTFDVSFTEAFIAELGLRLAPALTGLDTTKLAAAEGQAETNVAMMTEG